LNKIGVDVPNGFCISIGFQKLIENSSDNKMPDYILNKIENYYMKFSNSPVSFKDEKITKLEIVKLTQ
jgi:hypothetical protein